MSKFKSIFFVLIILTLAAGFWLWHPKFKPTNPDSAQIPKVEAFLYAIKTGKQSTVYRKDKLSGKTEKIWEFKEPIVASLSGNYWEGLPPNVALSPDKNSLAYIDTNGLNLVDLQTRQVRNLIRFIGSNNDIAKPILTWEPPMPGVSVIAEPLWSADGKSILFHQGYYEWSSGARITINSRLLRQIEWSYMENDGSACAEAGIVDADRFCLFLGSN